MKEPREALTGLLKAPFAVEIDDEDKCRGMVWARGQYWLVVIVPVTDVKTSL